MDVLFFYRAWQFLSLKWKVSPFIFIMMTNICGLATILFCIYIWAVFFLFSFLIFLSVKWNFYIPFLLSLVWKFSTVFQTWLSDWSTTTFKTVSSTHPLYLHHSPPQFTTLHNVFNWKFLLIYHAWGFNELPESKHWSVQFSSVTQSCPTLCDRMNHSTPGLPVHHQLPEFTQTHVYQVGDAIQPSHLLPSPSPPAPIPPSIRVFSNESTLCMRWQKYWSFSFSISPSNEHPGLISFRMD